MFDLLTQRYGKQLPKTDFFPEEEVSAREREREAALCLVVDELMTLLLEELNMRSS